MRQIHPGGRRFSVTPRLTSSLGVLNEYSHGKNPQLVLKSLASSEPIDSRLCFEAHLANGLRDREYDHKLSNINIGISISDPTVETLPSKY